MGGRVAPDRMREALLSDCFLVQGLVRSGTIS